MKELDLVRKALLYASAAALYLGGLGSGGTSLPAQGRNQDEELAMGQEIFNELKANGEIVESSPLYDQLRPIADAITRAAQPQYDHPFKFYLIHEDLPDAFAAPGGNVYVVDSFLYFIRNSDELAGTLCHEVSHTIHHDTVAKIREAAEDHGAGGPSCRASGDRSRPKVGYSPDREAPFPRIFTLRGVTSGPGRFRYLRCRGIQSMGFGMALPGLREFRSGRITTVIVRPSRLSASRRFTRVAFPRTSMGFWEVQL